MNIEDFFNKRYPKNTPYTTTSIDTIYDMITNTNSVVEKRMSEFHVIATKLQDLLDKLVEENPDVIKAKEEISNLQNEIKKKEELLRLMNESLYKITCEVREKEMNKIMKTIENEEE